MLACFCQLAIKVKIYVTPFRFLCFLKLFSKHFLLWATQFPNFGVFLCQNKQQESNLSLVLSSDYVQISRPKKHICAKKMVKILIKLSFTAIVLQGLLNSKCLVLKNDFLWTSIKSKGVIQIIRDTLGGGGTSQRLFLLLKLLFLMLLEVKLFVEGQY